MLDDAKYLVFTSKSDKMFETSVEMRWWCGGAVGEAFVNAASVKLRCRIKSVPCNYGVFPSCLEPRPLAMVSGRCFKFIIAIRIEARTFRYQHSFDILHSLQMSLLVRGWLCL